MPRPIFAGVLAGTVAAAVAILTRQFRRRLLHGATPPSGGAPSPRRVVFFGPATEYQESVVERLRTEWIVESASSDPEERAAQAAAATVLVGGLPPANALLRQAGPSLRLLQCHFTGVDWLDKSAVPLGVPVCNATGMEVPIAEWVLGAMLRHVDGIGANDTAMRAACSSAAASGADLGFAPPFFAQPAPPGRAELSCATVGIVGYGLIGSCIAQRAAAFGCRVVATVGRPTPPPVPAELAWLGGGGAADLRALLAQSDFVVVACPLSERTTGLLGAAELAHMRRGAVLINIARGAVVDEAALYAALVSGHLGGAALDVWWRLPRVADGQRECAPCDLVTHPFHALPHVTLSPHTSGWSEQQLRRRWDIIAANLDAVAEGRAPRNEVYRGA